MFFILIRAYGAKWSAPNYLHRLLLSQFINNGLALTLRPIFFSPTQVGEQIRDTNRSYSHGSSHSHHMLSVVTEHQMEGELLYGCQVIWVRSYHWTMRRKKFWVRTESSVKLWCSATRWAGTWLIPWLSQYLILLAAGAQHFTYCCRFSSCGTCSILLPGGLMQEDTLKLLSLGEAVKTCSSCVCQYCSTW